MDTNQLKFRVALISVASNTLLVGVKLMIGLSIGSVAGISEAAHSAMDLVAAFIAFLAVRASGKPADSDHPFGHGKFENISGAIEALLIFGAAIWIIWEAIGKLLHPSALEAPALGAAVMALSAVVNIAVSSLLFRVGKATDSIALKADAWHLRTDVYTSLGVMAGMAVLWCHDRWFPGIDLHWVDPVAAMLVALLILRAAWELTLQSVRDLLDVRLPPDEEERIKEVLRQRHPELMGYHKFKTRKSGATRFVEFHALVAPDMPVNESHRINHDIAEEIRALFPGTHVMVHIEPCEKNCDPTCLETCLRKPAD